jgi:hypothetical protein
MLDVVLEYPGGKLEVPRLEMRDQVGHSISRLSDVDATLSFQDDQGHSYKQSIPIRPYDSLLLLLGVQPVLKTEFITTSDGKEEAVVKVSPDTIFVTRSYQKPGWKK